MRKIEAPAAQRRWQDILFSRRMLTCVFLGFTSGMPLWVLISLVPAWLRTEGIDLATIGLFSLMTLPYTWKFIWSPLMDRYRPPFLGRRRGWALITQVVLLATIGALGLCEPGVSLVPILLLVFTISFFSASQDIVIDAYRRELLADDELGTGTSIHINAYRLSALVPGSLALILADHFSWTIVFAVTAVFMTVGIVMTLIIPEVSDDELAPHTLREAIIEPFREFFGRDGLRQAFAVLAFILLYKLGDNMAVALATPSRARSLSQAMQLSRAASSIASTRCSSSLRSSGVIAEGRPIPIQGGDSGRSTPPSWARSRTLW